MLCRRPSARATPVVLKQDGAWLGPASLFKRRYALRMPEAVQFLLDHNSLCDSLRRAAAGAVSARILTAWATCGAGIDCLRACRAPDRRAIIGTTFAATEPEALHKLMRLGFEVRVIDQLPDGGTFHPKVYLFGQRDGTIVVMLGSANLTHAAFTTNAEAMVLTRVPRTAASQLVELFEGYWCCSAVGPITDEWFEAYVDKYGVAVSSRKDSLARAERGSRRVNASSPWMVSSSDLHDLMQSDWAQYVRRLSSRTDLQEGYLDAADDSYLHTLSLVTPLLRSGLANADQRSIARILGRLECGWFGTVHLMRGRGAHLASDIELRALVDESIRDLWHARSDADCVAGAQRAFERLGAIEGLGPGFITRMLAIARPDRFYSCNKASRDGLASLFGMSKSRLSEWDGYKEGLAVVYSTRWFNAPRPARPRSRRLWLARVALLDAYAYQQQGA